MKEPIEQCNYPSFYEKKELNLLIISMEEQTTINDYMSYLKQKNLTVNYRNLIEQNPTVNKSKILEQYIKNYPIGYKKFYYFIDVILMLSGYRSAYAKKS